MFKKTKLIAILFIFFNFLISTASFAYDRFAKVVFLGHFCSGKTTLYNLLTQNSIGMNTNHTTQIDYSKVEFKVKDKSVCAYLFDTPGEPTQKVSVEEFCKNAHIIFVVVNAKNLMEGMNGVWPNKSQNYFENLLCSIPGLSPNCRIIVVLTQKYNINKDLVTNAIFVRARISQYIENINECLNDSGILVDSKYELTLKDIKGEEAIRHKNNLYDIIVKSLENYGIENLPKDPDGFREEIKYIQVEKKSESKSDCKIF